MSDTSISRSFTEGDQGGSSRPGVNDGNRNILKVRRVASCSRGIVSKGHAGNHGVAQVTGPAPLLSIASGTRQPVAGTPMFGSPTGLNGVLQAIQVPTPNDCRNGTQDATLRALRLA